MLHGRTDAGLRLICLGHHPPLVPSRCCRHLGAHLPNPPRPGWSGSGQPEERRQSRCNMLISNGI